jgi:predicted transcriptional regulator of viral defense system/very-short-patch-repair endonuclease
VDQAIAALAAAQHAVVSLDQLDELGLSASAARRRAARGRLHRIHPAVYSLVPRALLTRRGHWMAAVLACGPDAVLSHRNAAALHGIRDTARAKIDVTIPRRSSLRRPGIDVHRAPNLLPPDITVADNIPCTSVARTQLDLAEVVSYRSMERAFDESEVLELFDLRATRDQLTRNPTRPGSAIIKRVLEEHYVGSTLTESEIEEAFFALCRRYRLPKPQVQQWIDLEDGGPMIRADFAWRRERVIVETDGAKFHGTAQARERDPRRDQRATVAGWRPIRTTKRQIVRRPQELGPTLVRLVGAQ